MDASPKVDNIAGCFIFHLMTSIDYFQFYKVLANTVMSESHFTLDY